MTVFGSFVWLKFVSYSLKILTSLVSYSELTLIVQCCCSLSIPPITSVLYVVQIQGLKIEWNGFCGFVNY